MTGLKKIVILAILPLFAIISWILTIDFTFSGLLYLRSLSLLFAAVGLSFIVMQFLLSSRIKLIENGIGLDSLMRMHRFSGRAGLAMIFLHLVFIAFYRFLSYEGVFLNIYIWIGIISLLAFSVTGALASTYKKLGLRYETWRNIHLLNYLIFPVALIHVFYHSLAGSYLYYFWFLLSLLFSSVILYRFYRIIYLRISPYTVTAVKQEAEDVWSLHFQGRPVSYKPGQFLFLQLLRKGKRSSPHPFTISSSPTAGHLSVTPKELGDFTTTIKDTREGDKAFIDAPYGVFSYLNHPESELVFIAGGIGITPFMSMLRYMHDRGDKRKITLFWGNKSESNICFKNEMKILEQANPDLKMVLVMSDQPDWTGEKGYLDIALIKKYLATLDEKEFFVCGPPAMTKAILESLKKDGVSATRIHSELFSI